MLVWSHLLKPGDIFIDVGANVGTYSIWATELGAQVIALEPAEDSYGLLTENVRLNGYKVQTIRAAAGAACGTTHFTRGLDDRNRIYPDGSVQVEMVTIDSLINDQKVAK